MCAKIKLRLDGIGDNKFIKIPLSLEFKSNNQEDVIEKDFIDVEVEKTVNPIVDFEKVRFTPINTNLDEITSLTINLNFLDENGDLLSVSNYADIGFVDNDIKYRKSNFLSSFLRLNFYDSDITTNQNLISQSTIYSKITSDDIIGLVNTDSGTGNDDGDNNDGDVVTTYTIEGITTANCSSGMEGVIVVGSTPITIYNDSFYYIGFGNGVTIFLNGTTPLYNGHSLILEPNQTYEFISGQLGCDDGSGASTLKVLDIAGKETTLKIEPNAGGGLPLSANKFPIRFILTNPITTPKGFSEGFYLYHFKSELIKNSVLPKYLYMRAEFNNASTGKTTRFITTTDILPINLLMDKLHIRYLLTRTNTGYYYRLDNTYNDAININESGLGVTLNLYEIQVE